MRHNQYILRLINLHSLRMGFLLKYWNEVPGVILVNNVPDQTSWYYFLARNESDFTFVAGNVGKAILK